MFLESILQFDKEVAMFFAGLEDPVMHFVFSFVTVFGDWWFVLGVLVMIALVLQDRHRNWRLSALVLGFLGTQATVFLLKYLVGRERPGEVAYSAVEGFSSTASFPSGHAATAMAFYGLLLYLIVAREKNPKMKKIFFLSGALFIFLIGFSRIYIGVHYPSDVLVGFLIGAIFLFLSVRVAERKIPQKLKDKINVLKDTMQKKRKNDKITKK